MRTTFAGSPHAAADDILLRFEDVAASPDEPGFVEALEASPRTWRPAWRALPEVRALVGPMMNRVGAYELARLMITRLSPGKTITPHADTAGAYANLPDGARYHVVLRGEAGSLFHCGGETVQMKTGEVWYFNHRAVHSVENNSAADRIHLLFDVRVM